MTTSPLVSFCVLTYNQESYVAQAVKGALAQTYEPLEIVISDDNSTDRTVEIIDQLVHDYKSHGGRHQIVFNRNQVNVGVMRNVQLTLSLAKGVFCVMDAGDDISLPERTSEVMRLWTEGGRKAACVIHDVFAIDPQGRPRGNMAHRVFGDGIFGAGISYRRDCFTRFPDGVPVGAYEDFIYFERAELLGGVIRTPLQLKYYRVATGISSCTGDYRVKSIAAKRAALISLEQVEKDLEFLKGEVSPEVYTAHRDKLASQRDLFTAEFDLWSSSSFRTRWSAFSRLGRHAVPRRARIMYVLGLFPHGLSDGLLNGVIRVSDWMKRRRAR